MMMHFCFGKLTFLLLSKYYSYHLTYINVFLFLSFLSTQSLFGSWLAEKEKALIEVQTCDFKDPSEINGSVRRLAVSRQTCITLYL